MRRLRPLVDRGAPDLLTGRGRDPPLAEQEAGKLVLLGHVVELVPLDVAAVIAVGRTVRQREESDLDLVHRSPVSRGAPSWAASVGLIRSSKKVTTASVKASFLSPAIIVRRPLDADHGGAGNPGHELVGALLGHDIAEEAVHQKRGDVNVVHGDVEQSGQPVRDDLRPAVADEGGIPVPEPPSVSFGEGPFFNSLGSTFFSRFGV